MEENSDGQTGEPDKREQNRKTEQNGGGRRTKDTDWKRGGQRHRRTEKKEGERTTCIDWNRGELSRKTEQHVVGGKVAEKAKDENGGGDWKKRKKFGSNWLAGGNKRSPHWLSDDDYRRSVGMANEYQQGSNWFAVGNKHGSSWPGDDSEYGFNRLEEDSSNWPRDDNQDWPRTTNMYLRWMVSCCF